MKKLLAALMLLSCSSHAATLTIKDGNGAPQTLIATADGSGNLVLNTGGFNTYKTSTSGTLASTHAAGSSVGGLFSLAFLRTAGGSAQLQSLTWQSNNGGNVQLQARIWTKNPTSTTCTDGSAFVASATDDAYLVTKPPLAFTPMPAPDSTVATDAKTYYSLSGLNLAVQNADSTPGNNLYICITAFASDANDNSHVVVLGLSGIND
jgi:hypothetical protein